MADEENGKDIKLLKKTRISVYVDEALPDILVVTFEYGVKIFKGVLLDSTKRNLPCGVPNLNPALSMPAKNPDDDTLYAVNQRFAYTDPAAAKKKNVQMPSKYKNNKMTVRLRPRQVLCSKCKEICNENSENVARKRKCSESRTQAGSPTPSSRRSCNAPITRSVNSVALSGKRSLRGREALETRLTRLTGQEESSVGAKSNLDSNSNKRPLGSIQQENSQEATKKHSSDHSSDSCNTDDAEAPRLKIAKRMLRKKRSIGSAEEQWEDANSQENPNKPNPQPQTQPGHTEQPLSANSVSTTNTRTIKISYGPQGEGTVLKIPAQIENLNEDDSEENINIDRQDDTRKDTDNKAARRALKRAKKEARRKILLGGSPLYLGGTSPRYAIGSSSPRYTVGSASPRHGLGNNSPRYMCTPYELTVPRRRKHKMKHKKKHREDKDRKHKEGEVSSTQDDSKEQCITQKLSINLKRLNNTYTSCAVLDKIDDNMSSSDEHNEQVPNFPPPNPPLMLRINAQTMSSAVGADGVRLLVGDVVWGKIHGFPWWPGKILTMTSCGAQGPQAHVAWYGSSTSSLMQCDQLSHYLDNFKVRYNKKKKGPYKEAIKQATTEARENAENRVRQPLGNSPSHNIIQQVVPPALASPREIDVVS
ncbi:hypothetical protein NQ318_017846 [Aromia moschata]|uniref:PWWP domain-containing protein n=1 Tax=Aromia moschata TaxID=1265417 RepID=A0AAV8XQK2_9CUCU|nr:hypothetical protein NQ318_017846 [Aromia moschata]